MGDLRISARQMDVLIDVSRRRVWLRLDGDRAVYRCGGRTVTASVARLIRVGLVVAAPTCEGAMPTVTAEGRALLDGGGPDA